MAMTHDQAPAGVSLFCFPYAGGSSAVYARWRGRLLPGIKVHLVQFPGRGTRFGEPPLARAGALVESLAATLRPELSGRFAFFGHSMGALVSFELARRLRERHGLAPLHLFVSGCTAPQVFEREPQIHSLPDAEFIGELRRLNGTPAEVFDHPELMRLLLPGLRADFAVCETYEYREAAPLACPITAFAGLSDGEVGPASVEAWRLQTTGPFSFFTFPGGHFFVHDNWEAIVHTINAALGPFLDGRPS